jgi:predicted nucleotidyltransferase component of viral defense system
MININLLTRGELEILNKRTLRYPLAVAEKDYLLAVVTGLIYSSRLKNKLVFKGGTAIHHCYLPQARFSEDLDFTSLDKNLTLDEVREVLESYDFLEVKEHYVSDATIKIERLKYSGSLIQPNSLKVEIDFIQNVVLPPCDKIYRNVWKVDTKANVMDIREICAEKIRAASGRARYRDFYDLALLFKDFKFDLGEIIKLIESKEIRESITQRSMLENWELAKKEKETESLNIYYNKEVKDSKIEELLKNLKVNVNK